VVVIGQEASITLQEEIHRHVPISLEFIANALLFMSSLFG